MQKRLKEWWRSAWEKKFLFLFLAFYKIVEDWGLGKLIEYISAKKGVLVTLSGYIIDYLPWVTWIAIPMTILFLIVKTWRDSAKAQVITGSAPTVPLPIQEKGIDESTRPNVLLSACFVERIYFCTNRENILGHLDIAFVEFRNDPSSRLPDATARSLNATISYFDSSRTSLLIDRNIVGLWRHMPIPEVFVINLKTGLIAYPDYLYISNVIDLLYTGTPMGLFVILKHENDDDCYVIDSKHFRIKTPSYKISQEEIHVKVKLTGQRVDKEYWLILKNEKNSIRIYQDVN